MSLSTVMWMAGAAVWALLFLTACGTQDPAGPQITVSGNTAPVNVTTGSSSPVGTAPCAAASTQKAAQPTGPSQDCSTDTTSPPTVVETPAPLIVRP